MTREAMSSLVRFTDTTRTCLVPTMGWVGRCNSLPSRVPKRRAVVPQGGSQVKMPRVEPGGGLPRRGGKGVLFTFVSYKNNYLILGDDAFLYIA